MLTCFIDNKLTYLNKKGKIVWQDNEIKAKEFKELNVDFMTRGYFRAFSERNKKDIGGFGISGNYPKKISKSDLFNKNSVSVLVDDKLIDTIGGVYKGITVYLANTTSKKIDFNAQDSRIHMKVQALNAQGVWNDIEYLPSSWCGNSYHTLTLKPKYFWKFVSPKYAGDIKTKLRIELRYINPKSKGKYSYEKEEITIYSNEYEGFVNPAQFWRKLEYFPQGIMDPYFD